jgi:hypothetical protein
LAGARHAGAGGARRRAISNSVGEHLSRRGRLCPCPDGQAQDSRRPYNAAYRPREPPGPLHHHQPRHSRGESAERREVDLNNLVEEALNLAYHGARAQDQKFNITLERDFGAAIPPIELVPQDITRVCLNLFGNGFYAATKREREGGDPKFPRRSGANCAAPRVRSRTPIFFKLPP